MVLDESPTTHRNLKDKARERQSKAELVEKCQCRSFSCNHDMICGARQTMPRLRGKSHPQPTQRQTTVIIHSQASTLHSHPQQIHSCYIWVHCYHTKYQNVSSQKFKSEHTVLTSLNLCYQCLLISLFKQRQHIL